MRDLLQDVRFASRQLRKNKTFPAIAVTTLALGVGASTAIFSVVNEVLLAPLPYKQVDRLAMIWGRNASRGDLQFPISPGDFTDWKQRNDAFEDIAASYDKEATLTGVGEPKMVLGYAFTPNSFRILNVEPKMGRTFSEQEADTKAQVTVSSDKFWRNTLHGDPNVLGKSITLDDKPYTIIGVMPPGFQYPPQTELWESLSLPSSASNYEYRYIHVIGRLKSGISIADAQLRMNALERQIALQHPKTDAGNEIWVEPVRHQAQRNDVLRQILRYGMRLILAGVIAGCGIALLVMQFVSGVLYGVSPRDPWTFSIVVLALTGVALVACYIPARRAMRVDPMVALRYE